MKHREIILKSGARILLGKDAESNDELMKKFIGKENTILHTVAPGSPFCVIKEPINPSDEILQLSGSHCASYSQDWRDNKKNVKMHVFTGKQIKKPFFVKKGTWKIKGKAKVINIKKKYIEKCQK